MTIAVRTLLVLAALTLIGAAARPPRDLSKRLMAIGVAYNQGDCAPALGEGAALLASAADMPDTAYVTVVEVVATCEFRAGADSRALAHLMAGTAKDAATANLWRMRLGAQLKVKSWTAAMATLEAMLQGHGAALNGVPSQWLWSLYRALDTAEQRPLRSRLMQIAVDSYSPEEPFLSTDAFRRVRAEQLHDGGDRAGAIAIIREMTEPRDIAAAALDPRFRDTLAGTDIRDAAEAMLARDRTLSAAHPDRLDGMIEVSGLLRQLGRAQEALEVLDAASATINAPGSYIDRDQRLNWWWDARARALAMLGRYDDAVAAFTTGAAAGEGSAANVSQLINLAELQNRHGRGGDALKTLAVFADPARKPSPYGEAELRYARGCAYVVDGRPAAAAADLAHLREHERDHPEALGDLLLCMGDFDGAAAAFVRRLDDPERRPAALLQLSDFDTPPPGDPDPVLLGRLPALKARADVRAAIERAGGIRRFNVMPNEL